MVKRLKMKDMFVKRSLPCPEHPQSSKVLGGFSGGHRHDREGEHKQYQYIPTLEDYCVSKDGSVWSHKTDKKLSQYDNDKRGWLCVAVQENDKNVNRKVHRLVAQTYIPNPEKKPCINHKDGNKTNNDYTNLEWCTHKENQQHAIANGLFWSQKVTAK